MIIKKKQQNFYVPWPDISEWNTVRDYLLSGEINHLNRAYDLILMWKLKYSYLPTYVESTLCILQVALKEYKLNNNNNGLIPTSDEHDLQLSYSTALIRFVNHVSNLVAHKYDKTLYTSAKLQNIPDWIVNIRHEAAHLQNLPSLDALHAAIKISFQWLIKNYWMKNNTLNKKIINYDLNLNFTEHDKSNAVNFFKNTIEMLVLAWSKKKHFFKENEISHKFRYYLETFLTQINELSLREICSRINHFQVFKNVFHHIRSEKNDFESNFKMIKTTKFGKVVYKFLLEILKQTKYKQYFIPALMESTFLQDKCINVSKWQKVLILVQSASLLDTLIENLMKMAANDNVEASKWLTILYPSLGLLEKKWAIFKVLRCENKKASIDEIKEELKSLKSDLKIKGKNIIAFKIKKPPSINLKMIEGVLLNPDTHCLKKIILYMKFIKPPLPKSTVDLIKNLIAFNNIKPMKNLNGENDKIFNLSDLKLPNEDKSVLSLIDNNYNDEYEGDWCKSKIGTQIWSKCPIGLLPFQSKVNCNLPEDHVWVVEKPQSKSKKTVFVFEN